MSSTNDKASSEIVQECPLEKDHSSPGEEVLMANDDASKTEEVTQQEMSGGIDSRPNEEKTTPNGIEPHKDHMNVSVAEEISKDADDSFEESEEKDDSDSSSGDEYCPETDNKKSKERTKRGESSSSDDSSSSGSEDESPSHKKQKPSENSPPSESTAAPDVNEKKETESVNDGGNDKDPSINDIAQGSGSEAAEEDQHSDKSAITLDENANYCPLPSRAGPFKIPKIPVEQDQSRGESRGNETPLLKVEEIYADEVEPPRVEIDEMRRIDRCIPTSQKAPNLMSMQEYSYAVKGLDPRVTEHDLCCHFEPYGTVVHAIIKRDSCNRPVGSATLVFGLPEENPSIVEDSHWMHGCRLTVERILPKEDSENVVLLKTVPMSAGKEVSEVAIKEAFSRYGTITDVSPYAVAGAGCMVPLPGHFSVEFETSLAVELCICSGHIQRVGRTEVKVFKLTPSLQETIAAKTSNYRRGYERKYSQSFAPLC